MRRSRQIPNWRMFALFDQDDGGGLPPGGGGGSGGGNGEGERQAGITALRARYNGDLERAVSVLYDENFQLRNKNRTLSEQLGKAKLPDGAVVLSKEDASLFEGYKKLGAPDTLVAKAELEAANGRLAALDTEKLHSAAAGLLGWKPSVLHDLAEAKGLVIEVKDETENGKPVKRVYSRPKADEKAPLVLLDKHVEQHLSDYLPALKEKAIPAIPGQTSAANGGAGGSGGSTLVESFIQRRNEASKAGNALAPATATAK